MRFQVLTAAKMCREVWWQFTDVSDVHTAATRARSTLKWDGGL